MTLLRLLAPLAALVAVAIAYTVYANERQEAESPLQKWFDEEDAFLSHLPHPWSTLTDYPSEGLIS